MYKIIEDDTPAKPNQDELVDFLGKMKVNQAFDLPHHDMQYVRYAMGKLHKTTNKRYSCFLRGDDYRCKRVS